MTDPAILACIRAVLDARAEMDAAPDGPNPLNLRGGGPVWQAAHDRYTETIGQCPGWEGLAWLLLAAEEEQALFAAEVRQERRRVRGE